MEKTITMVQKFDSYKVIHNEVHENDRIYSEINLMYNFSTNDLVSNWDVVESQVYDGLVGVDRFNEICAELKTVI